MEIYRVAKKLNNVLQVAPFAASLSQKRWCTLQDIARCRDLAYIVYFGVYYNLRHIALHYAVYK